MISNNYNPLDTCTQCQAQFNKRPPDHLMAGKCETCTRTTIEEVQNLLAKSSTQCSESHPEAIILYLEVNGSVECFSNTITLGTIDPNVPVFWMDNPHPLDT